MVGAWTAAITARAAITDSAAIASAIEILDRDFLFRITEPPHGCDTVPYPLHCGIEHRASIRQYWWRCVINPARHTFHLGDKFGKTNSRGTRTRHVRAHRLGMHGRSDRRHQQAGSTTAGTA